MKSVCHGRKYMEKSEFFFLTVRCTEKQYADTLVDGSFLISLVMLSKSETPHEIGQLKCTPSREMRG